MRVEDWFGSFLDRHMARHPREDWPDQGTEGAFYEGWRKLMIRVGADEAAADEASELLMSNPPRFVGDHPKALAETVTAIFKVRPKQTTEGLEPREEALRISQECEDCGGQGLTVRFRQKSSAPGRRTITLYCLCAYGRYLERTHRVQSPDVRKRIYDLADYPWLRELQPAVAHEDDDIPTF